MVDQSQRKAAIFEETIEIPESQEEDPAPEAAHASAVRDANPEMTIPLDGPSGEAQAEMEVDPPSPSKADSKSKAPEVPDDLDVAALFNAEAWGCSKLVYQIPSTQLQKWGRVSIGLGDASNGIADSD